MSEMWNEAKERMFLAMVAARESAKVDNRGVGFCGGGLSLVAAQIIDGVDLSALQPHSSPQDSSQGSSQQDSPQQDLSQSGSPSSLSSYEFAVLQDKEFKEKFNKASFEDIANGFKNYEIYRELATTFAPFLLFIRLSVNLSFVFS